MSFIIGGLGSLEVCFSRIDRAKKPELAKLRPFIAEAALCQLLGLNSELKLDLPG